MSESITNEARMKYYIHRIAYVMKCTYIILSFNQKENYIDFQPLINDEGPDLSLVNNFIKKLEYCLYNADLDDKHEVTLQKRLHPKDEKADQFGDEVYFVRFYLF